MDALWLAFYWTGPIGIGVFLMGLGVLFWGIGQVERARKSAPRSSTEEAGQT